MTLEIITADALAPLRHGFFTRRGGASSGVFEGLNCGRGSSDQSEVVTINRTRVAQAMDAGLGDLRGLHQVHSAVAVTASAEKPGAPPQADAIVTDRPGLVLAVLTADCAPVLFADHAAGVIGAAHAGWKGALGGVLEATLDAMEALGADRAATVAVIGPTISQASYEVGPEFFEQFMDEDPALSRFFAGGADDRMHFDLPGFALWRMREAGIGTAEWLRHCTYANPAMFYSFRRSVHEKQADYGRLVSTIRL
ncbi:peptidoglycan editing factor PgeF [Meridianimarinicoccus roseus]|uniref:Purine nucleoside phosphorylase n=1 Tax=Meridianimarinicoccus roseus TaxID=2072018 RepID=A0A2V2L8X6_9RHOB|nr:peptidoglycan editing factor PgeF [Meridianimarinicoccus roseus]PWR01888.1 peptidoglycan editing factor PgeF [Meridianimarinicoccus roseus]